MAHFRTLAIIALALVVPGLAAAWALPPVPTAPPPITFHAGSDTAAAQAAGWVGALSFSPDRSSYHVEVRGLSGGVLQIDALVAIEASPATAYRLDVADPFTGDLDPVLLRVRAWSGAHPPATDADEGVCAVVDLLSAGPQAHPGLCLGPTSLQLAVQLPTDASGDGRATLRPAAIALP